MNDDGVIGDMNERVSVRKCDRYDAVEVINHIRDIYRKTGGPEVSGKKVLVKPNILSDNDPSKCISTHPVVVEAMIRFLQEEGAEVIVGDSPAIHTSSFKPVKSGIMEVCESTGAAWVDFTIKPSERKLKRGRIKIASIIDEVDLIISLPKFK